jgi:hypothetical protein
MVEAAVSSTWIRAENCVSFERNTSGQVVVQGDDMLSWSQIGLLN